MSEVHQDNICGWRPDNWGKLVGLGSTTVTALIRSKQVESCLIGRARIIVTPPLDFLRKRIDAA